MSFFKNIFKKKPGGTFVGNLIRGVANKYSFGLLGNGAMMLKEGETAQNNDSAARVREAAQNAIEGAAINRKVTDSTGSSLKEWFTNNAKIIGGVVGLILLGITVKFVFFKQKYSRGGRM